MHCKFWCDHVELIRAMFDTSEAAVRPWCPHTRNVLCIQKVGVTVITHTRKVSCIPNCGMTVIHDTRICDVLGIAVWPCQGHTDKFDTLWKRRCDRDVLIRVMFDAYQQVVWRWWIHTRKVWCIPNCGVTVMYAYAQSWCIMWPCGAYTCIVRDIGSGGVTVMYLYAQCLIHTKRWCDRDELKRARFDALQIAVWPWNMPTRSV